MAKYVCDFATVASIGQQLIDSAGEMDGATSSYSSTIDGNLSQWTGTAKTSYKSTSDGQIKVAQTNSKEMEALGTFIKAASEAIEKLESELAALQI